MRVPEMYREEQQKSESEAARGPLCRKNHSVSDVVPMHFAKIVDPQPVVRKLGKVAIWGGPAMKGNCHESLEKSPCTADRSTTANVDKRGSHACLEQNDVVILSLPRFELHCASGYSFDARSVAEGSVIWG